MNETIVIDAAGSTTPFPHFWEHMFGSCHAPITLCEDWRNDLRKLKEILDVQYIRFHGIFGRSVGIYDHEDDDGNLVLNFTRADLIYDGLLRNGVRPFLELSFMPAELAATHAVHSFWYHPIVSPPKDPRKWHELIYKFAQHLVERYGLAEVANWYFEVWNEPNLDFWTGEPQEETYYQLYDVTADALKQVSPLLRVGGPATAQAAWVDRFIKHCADKNVPVDFVSTHIYPNDTALNVFGRDEKIPQSEMVARAVRKVHEQVKTSANPELPIIFSEYNAGLGDVQLDSPYVGAWLANNIRQCAGGLVTEMSYWTFTDAFFEEGGVFKSPFSKGFGLIATGSIPKAGFYAFKILRLLGDEQLSLNHTSGLATKRNADQALVAAIWNYTAPNETGAVKRFDIQLKGAPHTKYARLHLVDDDHGSPLKLWEAMGSPSFPSIEQQAILRRDSERSFNEGVRIVEKNATDLSLTLKPNALVVVEFCR
ncbi:MAG: glycosyl hydrolase family 39 [Verrucomicrobia bacterium]|nr:glycosyl hydrolase family 39 [Verrucomicrobiota bacterium]MBV9276127.1 glycosyl hydrolase family 39 [Verrucomicrobiota bacterium]